MGQFNSNLYDVRFESIQFIVAANCNLNWIGGGMWPYLKNTLRFVASWPHTKKSFCISVNLISVNLFHLSSSSTCQSLPLINLFPCYHGQSSRIWGYRHAFNWLSSFTRSESVVPLSPNQSDASSLGEQASQPVTIDDLPKIRIRGEDFVDQSLLNTSALMDLQSWQLWWHVESREIDSSSSFFSISSKISIYRTKLNWIDYISNSIQIKDPDAY